ncbi:MAG: hypothetical protein CMM07_25955 [Rhodopirellula sp.]|nr:hypothetical protein [Rhodopirellula sp.]
MSISKSHRYENKEDTTQMLDHAPVPLHFSITCTHSMVHELIHQFERSSGQMHDFHNWAK